MDRIVRLLLVVAAGFTLTACAAADATEPATTEPASAEPATTEPASAEPAAEPTESPTEIGAYGSDQALDALYDACGSGTSSACDTLYWSSPVDSQYETFALAQGADASGRGALEHTWTNLSVAEQHALCAETAQLGLDEAYAAFEEGHGAGAPTVEEFVDLIDTRC